MLRLGEYSLYFTQREDDLGRLGLSLLQKCIAALHLLAYGFVVYSIDEYLKLARSTTLECLEKFCEGIIHCYGEEFCRQPNVADTQRLQAKAEDCGFPGMLGSIDCMQSLHDGSLTATYGWLLKRPSATYGWSLKTFSDP